MSLVATSLLELPPAVFVVAQRRTDSWITKPIKKTMSLYM